jgi:lipid II:glycine glycyltransferase (peptidoglycan interpeptide bridge formation enzyme)
MINYNLLNYLDVSTKNFPFSFQSYYVDYVNETLKGNVFIFEFEKSYLCFSVRSKFGFRFVHLISEIYTQANNGVDYERFYKALMDYSLKNSISVIFPPQHLHTFKKYPIDSSFYELGIITMSLQPTIEEIFALFKPVYRRHIRSAEKAGVVVEIGKHLFDEFYEFYQSQMVLNNAVYDQKKSLFKILNSVKSNAVCAVARLNGKIEAVLFNLNDSVNAYYMWGASVKGAHNGSFRLLHWELMKLYKKQGLSYYSLGGYRYKQNKTIKQEKLENFKLGFGSIINDGYHFIWVLRPFHYKIYKKISSLLHFLRK